MFGISFQWFLDSFEGDLVFSFLKMWPAGHKV